MSQQGRDEAVFDILAREDLRQARCLTLIASENHCSSAVRRAQGSLFTDKYAEGYPGRRYYGGCELADELETLAIVRAKELFGAEAANVQPHSGTQANLAAYLALMEPGDALLGMALNAGGHLSHGFSRSHSGRLFSAEHYGLDQSTGLIDYEALALKAKEQRPKVIVAGGSAYPRLLDWQRIRGIADEVGAYLMADIAHPAGLMAGKAIPSPVAVADVVTMTTHKTLRGPRGGLILAKQGLLKALNSSVFPGAQGGPFLHAIAGKAVALGEALEPGFATYAKQVVANAKSLGEALQGHGYKLVTGGTDTHLILVDLRPKNMSGREAESLCLAAGLVVNKNLIPGDPRKPMETSGLRLGTAALTTRGMREPQMREIAELIDRLLSAGSGESEAVAKRVLELAEEFLLPG